MNYLSDLGKGKFRKYCHRTGKILSRMLIILFVGRTRLTLTGSLLHWTVPSYAEVTGPALSGKSGTV
jgi:hypothetical protein